MSQMHMTAYMATRWIHAAECAAECAGFKQTAKSTMKSTGNGWVVTINITHGDAANRLPEFERIVGEWGFRISRISGGAVDANYQVLPI